MPLPAEMRARRPAGRRRLKQVGTVGLNTGVPYPVRVDAVREGPRMRRLKDQPWKMLDQVTGHCNGTDRDDERHHIEPKSRCSARGPNC